MSNAHMRGIDIRQHYDERNLSRHWSLQIIGAGTGIGSTKAIAPDAFSHEPTHIAAVWDASEISIFVNGKRTVTGRATLNAMPASPRPLLIGTKHAEVASRRSTQYWFHGEVDEVRISRIARYQNEFQPPRRFDPDEHTLALYHLDESSGTIAHDASGHANHATIIGATWVDAAVMAMPSPYVEKLKQFVRDIQRPMPERPGGALRFDIPEARVEVPALEFDFSEPFTMEVWITPASAFRWTDWKRVFVSASPLSMSIQRFHEAIALTAWDDGRGVTVSSQWRGTSLLDRRTHVTGQWDGKQLALFINGRRVPGELQRRNLKVDQSQVFLISALKNVQTDSLTLGRRGNGKSHFGGLIDRFRLSKVARYSADFDPEAFGTDDATVLLYDFHEGSGSILHDISGNDHHAEIISATWLPKGEGK